MRPVHVVCDRFHPISESVYDPIIRGGSGLGPLDLEVETSGVDLIVYCRPPASVLTEAVIRHEQMEGVLERHGKIIRAYDDLMSRLTRSHNVFTYDWTIPGSFDLLRGRIFDA